MARGLAAVVVIIYHWAPMDRFGRVPLSKILWPAYHYGWLAVDLFFVVSGFIMFHLYRDKISQGIVTGRQFAWLRFSRLYPLHLLTLALAAAVYALSPPPLFVHTNTWGTALIHLAFLQGLGPQSWNHPSWSLTMEAVAYALFFLIARRNGLLPLAALMCIAGFGLLPVHENLSRAIVGFFAGGVVYFCCGRVRAWQFALIGAAGLALAGGFYTFGHERLAIIALQLLFFPSVVGVLAQVDFGMQLAWLGTLSYSMYMIHVPLELLLAKLAQYYHWQIAWALIPFILVVTGLGAISYLAIEKPVQLALRRLKLRVPQSSVA